MIITASGAHQIFNNQHGGTQKHRSKVGKVTLPAIDNIRDRCVGGVGRRRKWLTHDCGRGAVTRMEYIYIWYKSHQFLWKCNTEGGSIIWSRNVSAQTQKTIRRFADLSSFVGLCVEVNMNNIIAQKNTHRCQIHQVSRWVCASIIESEASKKK